MLFVIFGTGHFVTMSADESEAVLQSPPLRQRRETTHAVSSALKIDLPPAFKGDGMNHSQVGLDALKWQCRL